MASYWQKTHAAYAVKKNAGNAAGIYEGRSPFTHKTFEYQVWLLCFVAPSGSMLVISYLS